MRKPLLPEMAPNRADPIASGASASAGAVMRIQAKELFRQAREVEILHDGRIYRLRLTQLNKLILTA